MTLREEQDFGIEPETLNSLLIKENLGAFPAKGLEAALRVGKPDSQYPAHEPVKEDSCLLTDRGLVNIDEVSIYRSRTDGGVVSLLQDCGQQLIPFFDRRG